jgi:hypothetical protein
MLWTSRWPTFWEFPCKIYGIFQLLFEKITEILMASSQSSKITFLRIFPSLFFSKGMSIRTVKAEVKDVIWIGGNERMEWKWNLYSRYELAKIYHIDIFSTQSDKPIYFAYSFHTKFLTTRGSLPNGIWSASAQKKRKPRSFRSQSFANSAKNWIVFDSRQLPSVPHVSPGPRLPLNFLTCLSLTGDPSLIIFPFLDRFTASFPECFTM